MQEILELVGRKSDLFGSDLSLNESFIHDKLFGSRFLFIGGSGSIGQAVAIEIFKRDPRTLHVVDISENNMVELVRSLRSSIGYGSGDFRTFAIDVGSREFEAFFRI